jgi:hypothetical protein
LTEELSDKDRSRVKKIMAALHEVLPEVSKPRSRSAPGSSASARWSEKPGGDVLRLRREIHEIFKEGGRPLSFVEMAARMRLSPAGVTAVLGTGAITRRVTAISPPLETSMETLLREMIRHDAGGGVDVDKTVELFHEKVDALRAAVQKQQTASMLRSA